MCSCYLVGDWLDTLPFTEKLRLNALDVPEWQLPHMLKTSPPDLLRWKPPELVHPFSGNGLRGPAFDPNEVVRIRQKQRSVEAPDTSSPSRSSDAPSYSRSSSSAFRQPISDLDWKITENVLKLLR